MADVQNAIEVAGFTYPEKGFLSRSKTLKGALEKDLGIPGNLL